MTMPRFRRFFENPKRPVGDVPMFRLIAFVAVAPSVEVAVMLI